VVPVILFHAGLPFFGGGFVGVDVFFVISGYLITSIILSEADEGRFSFIGFYERRARRILPPLFLVALVSVPFAVLTMVPRDLVNFSKSLVAVSTFTSNVFFSNQSGYFDGNSDLKPMLHTWSLAVEEQYYLIFPLLLMLALRAGRKCVTILFVAVAIVSFSLAHRGSYNGGADFYLLPTRMWELLVGALVAVVAADPRKWAPGHAIEFLGALGIALIAAAVVLYGKVRYSAVHALAPTIGALLVIAFADKQTFTGRLLGCRALVAIGLVSYSAYLWHQPIFAFARLHWLREPSAGVFLFLSALSVGLAGVTYKLVEQPVRDRKKLGRRGAFVLAGAGALCLAAVGTVGVMAGGFESWYVSRSGADEQRAYELIKLHTSGDLRQDMAGNDDCHFWAPTPDAAFQARFASCAQKYGPATIALGDSHGMNIYNALARTSYSPFVAGLVAPGCRPWSDSPECPYLEFDKFLANNRGSIARVIFHVSGSHLIMDSRGRIDDPGIYEFRRKYQIMSSKVAFIEDYMTKMSEMTQAIWLGPHAEARVDFRDIKTRARTGFRMNPVATEISEDLDAFIRNSVSSRPRTFAYVSSRGIQPDSLLAGDCLTYRDQDHYSVCGEKLVGEKLKSVLSTLGAGKP
jgi:peptidoglycan/LPS O-acetylase OafA/YrhL